MTLEGSTQGGEGMWVEGGGLQWAEQGGGGGEQGAKEGMVWHERCDQETNLASSA